MHEKDLAEAVSLKQQIDHYLDRRANMLTLNFDLWAPNPSNQPVLVAEIVDIDRDTLVNVARAAVINTLDNHIQEKRQALKRLGIVLQGDEPAPRRKNNGK